MKLLPNVFPKDCTWACFKCQVLPQPAEPESWSGVTLGIYTFSKYLRQLLHILKLDNHWPKSFKAFLDYCRLSCFVYNSKRRVLAIGGSSKVGVNDEGGDCWRKQGGRHSDWPLGYSWGCVWVEIWAFKVGTHFIPKIHFISATQKPLYHIRWCFVLQTIYIILKPISVPLQHVLMWSV